MLLLLLRWSYQVVLDYIGACCVVVEMVVFGTVEGSTEGEGVVRISVAVGMVEWVVGLDYSSWWQTWLEELLAFLASIPDFCSDSAPGSSSVQFVPSLLLTFLLIADDGQPLADVITLFVCLLICLVESAVFPLPTLRGWRLRVGVELTAVPDH